MGLPEQGQDRPSRVGSESLSPPTLCGLLLTRLPASHQPVSPPSSTVVIGFPAVTQPNSTLGAMRATFVGFKVI